MNALLVAPGAPFLRLCAAVFLYFTAIGIGVPTLPRYVLGPAGGAELHVGLAVAVFSVTSVLLRPLVAPAARRWSPSLLLALGAIVVGVAAVALLLAPSPGAVIAVRAVAGVGEAFFFVLASAAVYEIAPPARRGEAMAYFSAVLSAGLLLSPVAGELLREHAGYGAVWIGTLALCCAAAALGATLRLPRIAARAAGSARLVVERQALPAGAALAASTWGIVAFTAFVPLYAERLGIGSAGPLFAVFAAVMIGVRLLSARLLDRVRPERCALFALLLASGGLALLALAAGWTLLIAGTAILAAGHALTYPALIALAVDGCGDERRTDALATATACFDGGLAAAALGLAAVLQLAGFPALYACAAVVAAVGAAFLTSPRAWSAA